MKAEEIKKLSNEEIISKIKADKEELFNLRFQLANGQLEKPSRLKDLRREVARLKTELRERELNMKKTRKEFIGKGVSNVNDKTITVLVETYKKHPLYGKRVKYSKKYAVHDEQNIAKVGDKVKIVETRPLSKTKYFALVEVVEKAIIL